MATRVEAIAISNSKEDTFLLNYAFWKIITLQQSATAQFSRPLPSRGSQATLAAEVRRGREDRGCCGVEGVIQQLLRAKPRSHGQLFPPKPLKGPNWHMKRTQKGLGPISFGACGRLRLRVLLI